MSPDDKERQVKETIENELKQVGQRRYAHGLADAPPAAGAGANVYEQAGQQGLVGLAFSGGGIRSATFNLGVLQGLAGLTKSGLLKYIDYLSTVSGGGYIGGWFVAWVQRAGGRLEEVERGLRPQRIDQAAPAAGAKPRGVADEPAPIFHLRRFSNYLSPRLGLLSADVWVLGASYLRNFLVCQLVLLPAVVFVLLLSRLLLLLYHSRSPEFVAQMAAHLPGETASRLGAWEWWLGGAILVLWFLAAFCAFQGSGRVRPDDGKDNGKADPKRLSSLKLVRRVVGPLLVAAVLFCWVPAIQLYKQDHADPTKAEGPELVLGLWAPRADLPTLGLFDAVALQRYLSVHQSASLVFLAFALTPAAVVVVAYLLALLFHQRWRDAPAHLLGVFVASVAGGVLLFYACSFLIWLCRPGPAELSDYVYARAAARVTTFGPPLVLGVLVLTVYLGIALLRNRLGDGLREWWSSLCAWLMIFAVTWVFVNLVAIYATAAVLWAGPWARAALGSGWLLTVVGGALAGSTSRTGPLKASGGPLDWLALAAPPVFVAGLLVGVSLLLHVLLDVPPNWEHGLETAEWARVSEPPYPPIRVTETKAGPDGRPAARERKEVVERAKVFDEQTAVSRVYWLGMFNTRATHVPEPRFQLTPADVEYFQTKRNLRPEVVAELYRVQRGPVKTKEDFQRQYATALAMLKPAEKALPGEVTQEEIIEAATDADLIDFHPGLLFVKLGLSLLACLALLGLAAWRVDVNTFSLHALYRNRLTRCYLGASKDRKPDPLTGFDPTDDMALDKLQIPADARNKGYNGPYLLVNAALNLVGGDELAWQERKAEAFLFSPLCCGGRDTGYCPTKGYTTKEQAGGLPLSTAVTISGAAASPNAGYHSSPAVTALLTVFNARLGAWLANPLHETKRSDPGPRTGFYYLFKELLGRTTATSSYVYLSDGGHFENLGAYELVRRRCRYVVVCDAGCDGQHLFEDLGNLIRKCRADFGVPIEIDTGALRRSAETRHVRWHCAVGKIRYDAVDYGAVPGTLVYLKPSLSGDEPADVLHYAAQHPDFPHETTADQFFTESQFESYRALGQHVAEQVFAEALDDVEREQAALPPGATADDRRRGVCQSLFSSVARRWFALPPEYESSFLGSTQAYIDLHRSMADDAQLRPLTLGMYPELAAALRPGADGATTPAHPLQLGLEAASLLYWFLRPRPGPAAQGPGAAVAPDGAQPSAAGQSCAEVHALLQMLQIMQNAWLSLNLDVHYAHPLNRGWMDVFYRWTNTPLFRRHWPVLRSEFARGFVSFCEKQVRMGRVQVERRPLPVGGHLPDVLRREFGDQWPEWGRDGLQRHLDGAAGQARCWLIHARMTDPDGRLQPPPEETPFGFVLVGPDPAPPPGPGAAYEFLIWVRGAYRNSGIGRAAALQALEELAANGWPAKPFRLIVRLPVGQLSGPGGHLLQSMWLTFFHHLGFTRAFQAPARATWGPEVVKEKEVVLERRFPPGQPGAAPVQAAAQSTPSVSPTGGPTA
jgi:hypothetical protein